MDTVELPEGPLIQFSHALEPQLRTLGMPTALKKGVIHLIKDYTVCKKGDKLTSEQARILKLFDHRHASFKMNLIALWSKDKEGGAKFKMLIESSDDETHADGSDSDKEEGNGDAESDVENEQPMSDED